jgi:hypothetical protein
MLRAFVNCVMVNIQQFWGLAKWPHSFWAVLNTLFNDNLSNEPYFGRIHLAGQYL